MNHCLSMTCAGDQSLTVLSEEACHRLCLAICLESLIAELRSNEPQQVHADQAHCIVLPVKIPNMPFVYTTDVCMKTL